MLSKFGQMLSTCPKGSSVTLSNDDLAVQIIRWSDPQDHAVQVTDAGDDYVTLDELAAIDPVHRPVGGTIYLSWSRWAQEPVAFRSRLQKKGRLMSTAC